MIGKMQPYTPHGDSNIQKRFFLLTSLIDATLYPSRGQQQENDHGFFTHCRMQPYTPHGDSNPTVSVLPLLEIEMQPYTPHGDSNKKLYQGWTSITDAALYPSRGQ